MSLQTDFPEVSGFVTSDEYETKRQHKQLFGMMLCARCSDLSHGRMARKLGGRGPSPHAISLFECSHMYSQLLSAAKVEGCVVRGLRREGLRREGFAVVRGLRRGTTEENTWLWLYTTV